MVGQPVFSQRRDGPGGYPNQSGERGSCNREFNRLREENGNRLRHGHTALDGGGRVSPVSAQEPLHVVDILYRDGIPQVELLHDRLQERVVDVAGTQFRRAVDRDREVRAERVTKCKRDYRHAEERWDEDEKPAHDVKNQAHLRSDLVRGRGLKDFSRFPKFLLGTRDRANASDLEPNNLPRHSLFSSGASEPTGTLLAEARHHKSTAAIRARTFDRRTVRGPPARATPKARQVRTVPPSRRSTRSGSRSSWSYSAS